MSPATPSYSGQAPPTSIWRNRAFYAAVKSADNAALVVLGGCGYDVLSSPPESAPRQFFDRLASAGRDAFDIFDVHLYGDPYRIPEYVATARQFMATYGYRKPVVAGEYGGPSLFEFPEVESALQAALAEAFASAPAAQSTETLAAQASQDTPERVAMKALYAGMDRLPGACRCSCRVVRPNSRRNVTVLRAANWSCATCSR